MSNIVRIEFKGFRRENYLNPQEFPLKIGDYAVVKVENGEHIGAVRQLMEVPIYGDVDENKIILRKPGEKDLVQYRENCEREIDAFKVCLKKIKKHNLPMKLVDVEFQLDRKKVTFYFTSDNRVDFRDLVKDLASVYRTRIDLRQIGARDEAKRFGGCGVCGRKLCCIGFLAEFEPINTQMAKDQSLPVNPSKLSGLCGRLKCCLKFEYDLYREFLQNFPEKGMEVKTYKGIGVVEKLDIFHNTIYLKYEDESIEVLTLEDLIKLLGVKS
ncbi:MAG: stage 0 sporulation family protein [Fidelibacterota bacterium]